MSADRLANIDRVMRRHVDDGIVAGISTLAARRGQIVHRGLYGHRDREADLPMTTDTIFRIYSMTKPIVTTALMMLHEEGAFQLDHPVARYLPAFWNVKVLDDGTLVDPLGPMDVRHLLTHTSGLTYDFLEDSPVCTMYRDARIMNDPSRTLAELTDAIAELPLAFHPGQRWHYSVGIDVAGRLIEILADRPLGEFLRERIFEPLGMADTGFGVPTENRDRLAAMYGLPDLVGEGYSATKLVEAALAGFNERIDVSATYPTDSPATFQRGGVGLFSTIDDYHRFAQLLLGGGQLDGVRLLSRTTLAMMHTNHIPAAFVPWEIMGLPQPGMGFGLGSRVLIDPGQFPAPGSVGEYGWAGAAKTYFWVDPAEQLTGVFMSQYMTGPENPDRLFRNLIYQAIVD